MSVTRTIVFMGCSITDAGHKDGDLGNGYAAMTAALLRLHFPKVNFRFINSGISGNCAYQCRDRWEQDVLAHRPDFVTFMGSGNDSYLFSLNPETPEVDVRSFRRIVDAFVTKTLSSPPCRGMVLIPQHYLCSAAEREQNTFPTVGMIDTLAPYTRALCAIGKKHGIPVIRCDRALCDLKKKMPTEQLAPDFVHPTTFGHAVMAKHLTEALIPLIQASL